MGLYENKTQDIYILQNKSDDQSILSFRFNCQLSNQKPTFYLYNAKGEQILSTYDDKLGQIQFLLDNKNYLNPFNLYSSQKLETFKKSSRQPRPSKFIMQDIYIALKINMLSYSVNLFLVRNNPK